MRSALSHDLSNRKFLDEFLILKSSDFFFFTRACTITNHHAQWGLASMAGHLSMGAGIHRSRSISPTRPRVHRAPISNGPAEGSGQGHDIGVLRRHLLLKAYESAHVLAKDCQLVPLRLWVAWA